MITVAIEIGGTFTDLVLAEDGRVARTVKVPSTPKSPEQGALAALDSLGLPLGRANILVHGSTVATNAVLERKGARIALLVTEGFRDVLEIQREERENIYDLHYRKPAPLVSRDRVQPVRERLDASGAVVVPLDEDDLIARVGRLAGEGVDAIAVCLLHAYRHPQHEERVAAVLGERFPNLPVTISSRIIPEFREYERASTTTLNAYIAPIMADYIRRMQDGLGSRAFSGSFRIVQSNGGVLPAEHITDQAVRCILSGPAAGVIGSSRIAEAAGLDNVITFDMGGTSTDVCLVAQGRPEITTDSRIDGLPVRVPMIDIVTVGAGGGSIASVDAGRLLAVGPQSAGADPGPACYGRGGTQPTVTDANLVLGRIRPDTFFGGRMRLDTARAEQAVDGIATRLGLSRHEAAESIVRVANAGMAHAIRLVSVEKGYDPRDYSLLAFGGAGPLHAVALAEELDVPRVLVPVYPGVLSAFGLLASDFKRDYVRSVVTPTSSLTVDRLTAQFSELDDKACEDLIAYAIPIEQRQVERIADLRYVGQAYELSVPFDLDRLGLEGMAGLRSAFHRAHEARYGHATRDEEVELVNLRLVVSVPQQAIRLPMDEHDRVPSFDEGQVFVAGAWRRCGFVNRANLPGGQVCAGPMVVEEDSATTFIPAGWAGRVDRVGNIIIERQ